MKKTEPVIWAVIPWSFENTEYFNSKEDALLYAKHAFKNGCDVVPMDQPRREIIEPEIIQKKKVRKKK